MNNRKSYEVNILSLTALSVHSPQTRKKLSVHLHLPNQHLMCLETERAVKLARMALQPPLNIIDLKPRLHRVLRTVRRAQPRVLPHPLAHVQQQHRPQAERPHVVRLDGRARPCETLAG